MAAVMAVTEECDGDISNNLSLNLQEAAESHKAAMGEVGSACLGPIDSRRIAARS